MKTSLSFFVPGQPIAQPRHRVSGKHRYIAPLKDGRPHPIHAWKELIALTAKQQEWEIVKMPDGIIMSLYFILKRPKGNKRQYHTTKPDRDNLMKAVKDALEGIIYENDSQSFSGIISKQYEDRAENEPGVTIQLRRVKNENMSVRIV